MSIEQIRQEDDVGGKFKDYLNDESGLVKNGNSDKIFFPTNTMELELIIKEAIKKKIQYTISGGGTGITGGRVPLGGWIIATDDMCTIGERRKSRWTDKESGIEYEYSLEEKEDGNTVITVPIAMTLKSLQNLCREVGWFYPVDPTERSSFIGGNVATNASGARTFKYGTTRDWVTDLEVIVPNGETISLHRSGDKHIIDGKYITIKTEKEKFEVPVPSFQLPDTEKNVAGPVITKNSQPIDLFIGTGGMFGVVTEVTLKLIRPPENQISVFIYTKTTSDAIKIIQHGQEQKKMGMNPIPMSIEYLGPRAVDIIKKVDPQIPKEAQSLVMLEQDATSDTEMMKYLEYWWNFTTSINVLDTSVAQTYNEIEHHKFLRHKVPETVNAMVRSYGQAKLGTDCSVPNDKFVEIFDFILQKGQEFEKYQNDKKSLEDSFGYAIWAHAGNSHFHLNLLPRDDIEDKEAKKLITEVLHKIIELNGSIAAEHGLGKKKFDNKPALIFQYGKDGLEEIRKMKQVLDPLDLLNHGNLIHI